MFNSRKINNDHEPYVGWSGKRYNEETRTFASLEDGPVGVDPRPEYDNNPNPILVEFREAEAPGKIYRWLDLLDGATEWSQEHIDHATKVLTRLVNIFGTEN